MISRERLAQTLAEYRQYAIEHGWPIEFDYTNQAWVIDGRYERCAHPRCIIDTGPTFQTQEEKSRYCYGTQHVGERPLGDPIIG